MDEITDKFAHDVLNQIRTKSLQEKKPKYIIMSRALYGALIRFLFVMNMADLYSDVTDDFVKGEMYNIPIVLLAGDYSSNMFLDFAYGKE